MTTTNDLNDDTVLGMLFAECSAESPNPKATRGHDWTTAGGAVFEGISECRNCAVGYEAPKKVSGR